MVYPFFSETIKVDLVDKMKCYSTFQTQEIPILAVFTWFIIIVWRHRPPAAPPPIKYTSSFREDQRLSTEGIIFYKYLNMSKTLFPLVPRWGITLRERPRVNTSMSMSNRLRDSLMERNKRSYHVPRLIAVRLTVYIAANITSKYLRLFHLNLSNDEILF